MTLLYARDALLPSGHARDVLIRIEDGRLVEVSAGHAGAPAEASILPGVVLPGFANVHSHAFHRALRGRTHADGGTFWTWREAMYALAARLDPDNYFALARAVFAEMVLAGITTVGEFHYVHHAPGGARYADPNAMSRALIQAAHDAGLRLSLLDTCYLSGGLGADGHLPLAPAQRRFSDGSVTAWWERSEQLSDTERVRIGAAIHSVRAVGRAELTDVANLSGSRQLHVHLAEQPAENAATLAYYGVTATELLAEAGALSPRTTVVHATHVSPSDIGLLSSRGCAACFCPSTEQDLADGIGPARALADAGVALALGTDQNAVIDVFAEAQALEAGERLVTLERGRFSPATLLGAATAHGTLGWPDTGRLEAGARADLVCVRTDSVRMAGALPEQLMLVARVDDIDTVYIDGEPIVQGGAHRIGNVASLLSSAIATLWKTASREDGVRG
jgi:formiminoglutamate deiminase